MSHYIPTTYEAQSFRLCMAKVNTNRQDHPRRVDTTTCKNTGVQADKHTQALNLGRGGGGGGGA